MEHLLGARHSGSVSKPDEDPFPHKVLLKGNRQQPINKTKRLDAKGLKPLYFSKSHHLFDITMVCTEHCVAFVLIGVLCQFQPRLDSFFSGTLTKSNLIFPMK